MPDENGPPPDSPSPDQPTLLGNLVPDELFARAMQTVKMTSGAAGAWQPPTVEEMARLFPNYEVLGLLGRGGMGAVYKARQIELDRLVAIKLLPLEISVDKDFVDRFRREARAMARLHHPNIITVFEFGTTAEGHLFFVMEFVEGANLQDVIHHGESAALNAEQALAIVEQVCTALAYAHGKGIVHRDIKPANVMIDTESHVKVADFGLARLTDTGTEQLGHTMTGTVMGTPDYMAPEQMKGMNVDHRADIYSVGVMLYEMLCREVPKGIFDPPSHRTGCDVRIDQIVIKAMQQSPDRRFQSTTEMKADVIAARAPLVMVAASTQEVHPRPVAQPALPEPKAAVMQAIAPPAPAKKSKLPLIAAAVVLVLGAVAISLKLLPKPLAPNTTKPASSAEKVTVGSGSVRAWVPLLARPEDHNAKSPTELRDGWIFQRSDSPTNTRYLKHSFRNGAVRAKMQWTNDNGRQQLMLGLRAHQSESKYTVSRNTKGVRIDAFGLFDGTNKQTTRQLAEYPVPPPAEGEVFALELRAVGSTLTVKLDGREVIKVEDTKITEGGEALVLATKNAGLRDIEVLDLDGGGVAPEDASLPPATTAAPPLEPGAIKFWDTPEKLPPNTPNVSVKDGVLTLNGQAIAANIGGRQFTQSDSILRFDVRFTAAARSTNVLVRDSGPMIVSGMSYLAVRTRGARSPPFVGLPQLPIGFGFSFSSWRSTSLC